MSPDTILRWYRQLVAQKCDGSSRKDFLRAHWGVIAACDVPTVEVLTLRGLVRYHVLIVIDLATRRVEVGGITCNPTGAWMLQAARNLLDAEDGEVA